MSDVSYVGSEVQEAEGYLQPRLYKITALCARCGNEFHWTAKTPGGKDRPCPRKACREAVKQEEIMAAAEKIAGVLEHGAPAVIGRNPYVKAADMTAEQVMTDYKMTDLRDNMQPGEMAAPKLPAPMQRAADGFFGGAHAKSVAGGMNAKKMEAIGKRAIAGAFRSSAVNPAELVGGSPTAPTFRSVGKAT